MKANSLLKWLCLLAGSICMSAYADMVLIPAGSFTMGDVFNDTGRADELPLHSVTVSQFYMESVEVSKAKWDEVYAWAIAHGYSFVRNYAAGKAASHPVQTVSWYDCVKWCNARSEKEGLTPCYYTTSAQTTVYRSGDSDISSDCVSWSASGYRLPTEAEWEKAARGGAAGHRFSWSDVDTITHSQANYWSNDRDLQYPYDVSPTRGYHPAYNDGTEPYTSPVGAFPANGYGVYDTIGNVYEWCWDWYGDTYYTTSAGSSDPRGLSSGTYRTYRGGDCMDTAQDCRVAGRTYCLPDAFFPRLGLRCVRSNADVPVPVIGPIIRANGATGTVIVNNNTAVSITVQMNADIYAGNDVDWWVIACAGSSWFYLDSAVGWTQAGVWRPVHQGALVNLPAMEVLNMTGLGVGLYTFYFAVDYPMDGVLNLGGQILAVAVNVTVQ